MGASNSRRLLLALAVVAWTDLATTFYGLEALGLVERNPVAADLYATTGIAGLAVLSLFGIVGVIGLARLLEWLDTPGSQTLATLGMSTAIAINAFATVNNAALFL